MTTITINNREFLRGFKKYKGMLESGECDEIRIKDKNVDREKIGGPKLVWEKSRLERQKAMFRELRKNPVIKNPKSFKRTNISKMLIDSIIERNEEREKQGMFDGLK